MPRSGKVVRAVLFDLDNTLFDYHHSLTCALSAVRSRFEFLQEFDDEMLFDKYDASLQTAYDEYLEQKISYKEKDSKRISLFYDSLGLPEPDEKQIAEFREVYQPAFWGSRMATTGSIEALAILREYGYRIAIVTNGQLEDQTEKARAIGVHHLVDKIITSEEAGCCKPDKRVFKMAIKALGASPENTYMVGDNPEADIKGGLDAGLRAILYSPDSEDEDKERELFGMTVPVLHSMYDLPGHLGLDGMYPIFKPRIYYEDSYVIAKGVGIDAITEPRPTLCLTQLSVNLITDSVARVFLRVAEKDYPDAISRVHSLIRQTTEADPATDETSVRVSYSCHPTTSCTGHTEPAVNISWRPHSIRCEYHDLVSLPTRTRRADCGNLSECFRGTLKTL
ncbi:had-superfamily subfamily variant 1 [Colletotrichum plurivorum]|uniref:Had-superfamily subfamily variant 1 n=1 Tax=Colletotrichum plurivorum TaxID=2175906 RepID=A0A8H6JU69_9PEZI|nr:had-superfamily subfamily variant 1 [Colletotrichum plurivorum]